MYTQHSSLHKKSDSNPETNVLTSWASQWEMHFRSESQEQVHGYLETEFVSEIFASPIDKDHVSMVEGQ